MTRELYNDYRPEEFTDVHGQDTAVAVLQGMIARKSVPHGLLFSGPSGCGKTTLARIFRRKIGCGDIDYHEMNCADVRGIDHIREIARQMRLAPMGGRCRVYLIDEAHRLTTDAQSAMLKMIEDAPAHVYFFLATTDPRKILATVRTRCTDVTVNAVAPAQLIDILRGVASKAGVKIDKEIAAAIAEASDGSARRAVVILDQIAAVEDKATRMDLIRRADVAAVGIEIARALYQRKPWAAVAPLIKSCDEDPEGLRYVIMGYAQSILLSGKSDERAFEMIDEFSRNFFDSKKAGLTAAAYLLSKAKGR